MRTLFFLIQMTRKDGIPLIFCNRKVRKDLWESIIMGLILVTSELTCLMNCHMTIANKLLTILT